MGDLEKSPKGDAEVPRSTLPKALLWLANLCLRHLCEADIFGNAFLLQNTRSRTKENTVFICPQVFSIMSKFFRSSPHEKMNFLF